MDERTFKRTTARKKARLAPYIVRYVLATSLLLAVLGMIIAVASLFAGG